MIEHGHLEAYRIAAENAMKAISRGDNEVVEKAERQMAAIRELEKARIEIFAKFNVPDVKLLQFEFESQKGKPQLEILNNLVKASGLNNREIALQSEITESHVSHILKGRRRPSRQTAKRILAVLGLDEKDELAQTLLPAISTQTTNEV